MGEVVLYVDALATFDRDRKAHELKIRGYSDRQISDQLGCSVDQVRAGIARMQGDIPPDWKRRTIQADLDRLDALWLTHFQKAVEGDALSTKLCLDMMERRARLAGLDSPPTGNNVFERTLADGRSTSTDKIRKIIDLVVNEKPNPNDGRSAPEGDPRGA